MDSEDEFNEFVFNEVIGSSSSDDEEWNFFLDTASIIAEDSLSMDIVL
jgi:hypothetical protein